VKAPPTAAPSSCHVRPGRLRPLQRAESISPSVVIIRGKNTRKPHTVRYWADGRQRERSFATAAEARDFKIKTDHDVRASLFVDDRAGREPFTGPGRRG
jgi:hypothetical protein